MRMRSIFLALTAALVLAGAPLAGAQQPAVDKAYEATKSAEISAARLRLATRPAAAGVLELNEAEGLLRRLKETTGAEARRKIASQLDLAVTRLNVVANGTGGDGR